jgi:hypothetical protein
MERGKTTLLTKRQVYSSITCRPLWFNARLLAAVFALLAPALSPAETAIQAWVQRYNGTGNNTDNPQAVAVNSSNSVIVTGTSYGPSGFDYATVQYSSAGVPQWTNRFNGPANGADTALAVVVDGSNNVIVTGHSAVSSNYIFLTIQYSAAGVPLWTNQYSGPGGASAQAFAAAVDRSNNVVVTGASGGNYVTIQYSSAGVPLWTNFYNGPANGADTPSAIAIDGSNNVIVTGKSTGGAIGTDFATIKYSSTGAGLWTNRFDGPTSSIDEAAAVAVDGSNNVIVTGRSVGSSGYYGFGTIKYSSQGVPLWTNHFREATGTTAYPYALAVDRDNNVFVTGSFFAGAYENVATVAYSAAGSPLWTNYYNGPANTTDIGRDLIVDDNNNVIVTAYSSGDYATIKYSNAGLPIWTNRYNGPGNGGDAPWAMILDHNGDFVVIGQSDGGASGFDYATIKFVSPPLIADVQIANGLTQIRMHCPNKVVIEGSATMGGWTPIFTNAATTNLLIYADPASAGSSRRFYRAVRSP